MDKYCVFILFLFISVSCKKKYSSLAIDPSKKLNVDISKQLSYVKDDVRKVNLDIKYEETVLFEEYFEINRFVFIDDAYLVGNIEKLIFYEDRFYIYDKISEVIFCIDMNGKILWEINSIGEGPNEYQKINDFDVDFDLKELHLWDSRSQKVLVFSISDGELLKVNKNHSFGSAFIAMDNKYFFYPLGFYNEDQAFNFLITDRENNLVGRALPFEEFDYNNSFLQEKSFSRGRKNAFYFSKIFNDTLYYYCNDTLNAQFVFQRDGKFTPIYNSKLSVEDYYNTIRENQISTSAIDNLIQVRDKIFFTFKMFDENFMRFRVYNGLLDLVSFELRIFEKFKDHPLSWKNQYPLNLLYSNDMYSFIYLDPAYFSNLRENWNSTSSEGYIVSKYFEEKYPELFEIVSKTNDESNPIIVVLKNK